MATTEQELIELRKQVEAERQQASGLDPAALDAYWAERRDKEYAELQAEQERLARANASRDSVVGGGEEKTTTQDDAKALIEAAQNAMTGGATSGGSSTGTGDQSESEQTDPEPEAPVEDDDYTTGGE